MTSDYNENYWDYISTLEPIEPKDTIRELVKDAYPLFLTFLEELYFIEANVIFLNLVHEISQNVIAYDIMHGGISQMGVSKRVNSGMNKIKLLTKRPEIDRNIIRSDLKMLLPKNLVEIAQAYYFYKTYSLTAEILCLTSNDVRNKVLNILEILKSQKDMNSKNEYNQLAYELGLDFTDNITDIDFEQIKLYAERYYNYMFELTKQANVGDYTFRGNIIRGKA